MSEVTSSAGRSAGAPPPDDLLALPVRELLDAVAARTPGPGAGAVAALVSALAAALAAMAARFAQPAGPGASAGLSDPAIAALIDRADLLRATAAPLADADIRAYGAFLATSRSGGSDARSSREALDEATQVPLAVAEAAAEVTQLAGVLARSGNRRLRGDAVTAVVLASAAVTAAAVLVAENVGDFPTDPRLLRTAELAAAARAAVAAALDPYSSLRG